MPEGDSFLPRIQSVFYAVFDVRQGPKIVYQVPEGLIGVPGPVVSNDNSSVPPTPSSDSYPDPFVPLPTPSSGSGLSSKNSSSSLVSPTDYVRPGGRHFGSPQNRPTLSQQILFNFNDISTFIIPHPSLCGRLVTCATARHRIIGFPVELNARWYMRNYFQYNFCFVFDRHADLSCYEPVVRKISRVLKSCEEESLFLSSAETSPAVHAILEQLYEDLNSYSETSIPINQFNSIELKILPFYPNPPSVKDWMVPLALINLTKRIEENWDLTLVKVCKFINGINHVSRIAHLADCDITLTRQAISHLLYYQVVMTIDIFQYSNMYTLRRSIQWLANERHVKDECGPYVTKALPGRDLPDWPKLLHLYSRLKPGKMVYEWAVAYDVESFAIDIRRFISFGVIKGFLRRVHRYPVYIGPDSSEQLPNQRTYLADTPLDHMKAPASRGQSFSGATPRYGSHFAEDVSRPVEPRPIQPATITISAKNRARRASAAEKALERLRGRDMQKSNLPLLPTPRSSWMGGPNSGANFSVGLVLGPLQASPTKGVGGAKPESRRHSLITPAVPPPSPVTSKIPLASSRPQRLSRSPSTTQLDQVFPGQGGHSLIPPGMKLLLDGEHHTDELSARYEVGWPLIEQWLRLLGGAAPAESDYGKIVIINK